MAINANHVGLIEYFSQSEDPNFCLKLQSSNDGDIANDHGQPQTFNPLESFLELRLEVLMNKGNEHDEMGDGPSDVVEKCEKITQKEVEAALRNMKNRKAKGQMTFQPMLSKRLRILQ